MRAIAAIAALALAGCARSSASAPPTETSVPGVQPAGFELADVAVTGADEEVRELRLWLAETPEQRGRGLMFVTDLGPADGMLFLFDDEAVRRFYMLNTPMPLSIAFFDAEGRFVGSADMEPCLDRPAAQCERYAPNKPFQAAIEVPHGELDELDLEPEAVIEVVPETTTAPADSDTSAAVTIESSALNAAVPGSEDPGTARSRVSQPPQQHPDLRRLRIEPARPHVLDCSRYGTDRRVTFRIEVAEL